MVAFVRVQQSTADLTFKHMHTIEKRHSKIAGMYPSARICLLIGVAVTAASLCTPADAEACPKFECGEGKSRRGKFVDPTAVDIEEGSTRFLVEAFFSATQMYNYAEFNVTGDETLAHPEAECFRYCSAYNSKLVDRSDEEYVAKYWMFEKTSDEGNGGICTCFNRDACSSANSFSPKWMEAAEGARTDRYDPASNWTVGSLCEASEKGDPHFTGADGSHYDFSGIPNKSFALISDAHIQINGFFGGRYARWAKSVKALTWIRSIAILSGHHTLLMEARRGASAGYDRGYLARVVADGNPVQVGRPGAEVPLWSGASLTWTGARQRSSGDLVDVFEVKVGLVALLRLTLRPEVAALRTATDGTIHFAVDVRRAAFSPTVHGVLGQTFRPDFAGRLAQQHLVRSDLLGVDVVPGDNAEGFIDGRVEDYLVSQVTRADCRYCRFARAAAVDAELSRALEIIEGAPGRGGTPLASLPRKFLVDRSASEEEDEVRGEDDEDSMEDDVAVREEGSGEETDLAEDGGDGDGEVFDI